MDTPPDIIEADVALPGRREALQKLELAIPGMREQTRTAMAGIARVWQPSDMLPSFTEPEKAFEDIRSIQRRARNLSPELLLVLIGDTVTEDGLPLFTSRLFTLHGLPAGERGDAHARQGNLQRWFNQWTGEEHRHGELLKMYLRMTGRVDMPAFERTVQLFLEDGMDVGIEADPYKGFIYTSFQELATQRSHMNVAKLAKQQGDPYLAQLCGQIASDEGAHARAYCAFVKTFFEHDPDGMMRALSDMLSKGIVMPAHNMREVDPGGNVLQPGATYEYFSNVAQQLGVYTTKDYAEISAHLLRQWKIGQNNAGKWEVLPYEALREEGQHAQHTIIRIQNVLERLAARANIKPLPKRESTWLVHEGAY